MGGTYGDRAILVDEEEEDCWMRWSMRDVWYARNEMREGRRGWRRK